MTATVTTSLTRIQRRLLEAAREYFAVQGYPPTTRELAVLVGRSPSTVQYQLGQLQRMGRIHRHPNIARSIVVRNPETGGL